MAYDTTGMTYNWVSDIIRVDTEPRVMKKEYVSPQTIKSGSLYKDTLISWIGDLEDAFVKKSVDLQYISAIRDLKNDIVDIMDKYHAGNMGQAYEKMKEVIASLINDSAGIAVSFVQNSFAFNDVEDVINNTVNETRIEFFRARTSDKFCVFNREEMLHIPFDLRERVSSTRFSIPGLPCLYLATTTYCCWLELRTPPDYQFNVSPVRINQKNRILNLMTKKRFQQYTELQP